jgi:hypothetical protein
MKAKKISLKTGSFAEVIAQKYNGGPTNSAKARVKSGLKRYKVNLSNNLLGVSSNSAINSPND